MIFSYELLFIVSLVLADLNQFCVDTGYSIEDQLGTIDDSDNWWERVGELCYSYNLVMIYIYIYIYMCVCVCVYFNSPDDQSV